MSATCCRRSGCPRSSSTTWGIGRCRSRAAGTWPRGFPARSTSRFSDTILDEIEEFLTGVRRGPEPDRVLATVLFTDIVDSTRKAIELGDRRWRDLLDSHHALVR